MRKLQFLFVLLMVSGIQTAWAQKMVVNKTDGTRVEFKVSEVSDVTFLEEEEPADEHEWVDLGLPSGTKWATCNVGASSPEEYGDYFAWGETEPKDSYSWSNYRWCNGSYNTMTKYCIHSDYGNNGFTDNKTVLDPEDDAATANWGEPWHMPTMEQMQEVYDNCSRQWTLVNGVNGILVTGPNGGQVFLPAAGYRWFDDLIDEGSYGNYWPSSLFPYNSGYACDLGFGSSIWGWSICYRYYGQSVRAVRP